MAFTTQATNDDGEPQLRVTTGKTYNTRGEVKEETDPRWLETVAVDTMREVNAGHTDPAFLAALEPPLIQSVGDCLVRVVGRPSAVLEVSGQSICAEQG